MDRISHGESLKTQVSESLLVLCEEKYAAEVETLLGSSPAVRVSNETAVFCAIGNDAHALVRCFLDAGWNVRRLLDRFHLVSPPGTEQDPILARALFELVSTQYEALIDTERNIQNYKILFELFALHRSSDVGKLVIDFGCGTGLGLIPAQQDGIKLVGVDPSPSMRELARRRGLPAFSLEEIVASRFQCDGVVCSYILHLLDDCVDLGRVWGMLRSGGILVGNFHKGKGKALAEECLQRLGGVAGLIAFSQNGEHGDYLVFRKP
jgi:SAM-dependent methyltransferase